MTEIKDFKELEERLDNVVDTKKEEIEKILKEIKDFRPIIDKDLELLKLAKEKKLSVEKYEHLSKDGYGVWILGKGVIAFKNVDDDSYYQELYLGEDGNVYTRRDSSFWRLGLQECDLMKSGGSGEVQKNKIKALSTFSTWLWQFDLHVRRDIDNQLNEIEKENEFVYVD